MNVMQSRLRSIFLCFSCLFLCTFPVVTAEDPATRLFHLRDVIRAVSQASSLYYRIDSVTGCSVDFPANLPMYNFGYDIDLGQISPILGKLSLITSNEQEVNGTRLNIAGPAIRSISTRFSEDGSFNVNMKDMDPRGYHVITSGMMSCVWGGNTNITSASLFQRPGSGTELSSFDDLHAAVTRADSLAFMLDTTMFQPPGQQILAGRIHGIRWNHNQSELVFSKRWSEGSDVTVIDVKTSPLGSVSLLEYTYSRMNYTIKKETTREGVFNFKGSAHFYVV